MKLSTKSGITYAFARFCAESKGFGASRHAVTAGSGATRATSPKIHSYKTFDRYAGIVKEFVERCTAEGVNKLHKLSPEVVDRFIESKIEAGRTESTISVNVSALNKFFDAVGRSDLCDHTRASLPIWQTSAAPSGRAQCIAHPDRVLSHISNDTLRSIATIQLYAGCRISEVPKAVKGIDPQAMTITLERCKGGRDRVLDFSDRPERFNELVRATETVKETLSQSSWAKIATDYYNSVRYAFRASEQYYTGAHSFRVTYAVERFDELTKRGLSAKEADKIITEELGHNRESMSRYYRGG